jgi:LAO/AO transport system kinase
MVDIFLLLMLAGAGDELQGMKRGIMEMADLIAITKADGENKVIAEGARVTYQNAINLFPLKPSGWKPRVTTCSARNNTGITQLWDIIGEHVAFTKGSGYFDNFRKQQAIIRMENTINEYLRSSFYNNAAVNRMRPEIEKQLSIGAITSYKAATDLLDKYFNR